MLKFYIILIIIIEIMLNFVILNFIIKNNAKSIKIKNNGNEEFNEIINKEYRKKQINFCNNINERLNHEFEDRIKLAKVIFNNIKYNMFVYKKKDIVSSYISKINKWEEKETNELINGLNYYAKKKNL
jgi:hypothetical protein